MNPIKIYELEIIKMTLTDLYYILDSGSNLISNYIADKFQKGEDRNLFLEDYKVIGKDILFFVRWKECW